MSGDVVTELAALCAALGVSADGSRPLSNDVGATARSERVWGRAVCAPLVERLVDSISAPLSSKSNTSKFSSIRSGVTDFGITTLPSCRCQRITTCAGVFAVGAAISTIAGSSSTALRERAPRLGHDPELSCSRRSPGCWKWGCSSTWLIAGVTPVSCDHALEVRAAEVRDADRADEPLPGGR